MVGRGDAPDGREHEESEYFHEHLVLDDQSSKDRMDKYLKIISVRDTVTASCS
jgi:hypothetical protein